jgi:hypothetical protein
MCTTNLQRVNKKLVGWKVVKIEDDKVVSFYVFFKWHPKRKHRAYNGLWLESSIFHCFARRSDARNFKRFYSEKQRIYNLAIIKVILSGNVCEGITHGMSLSNSNGLPATCGTEAYWDGKFHT